MSAAGCPEHGPICLLKSDYGDYKASACAGVKGLSGSSECCGVNTVPALVAYGVADRQSTAGLGSGRQFSCRLQLPVASGSCVVAGPQ